MDLLTIVMLVVLAVLIFFMFRNSRKRQRDLAALQSKVVVGAEVMTNFGAYGRILSMDEESNEVLLESTPGTVLKLHRQVIARVVEPKNADEPLVDVSPLADEDDTVIGEPEFGERLGGQRLDGEHKPKIDE